MSALAIEREPELVVGHEEMHDGPRNGPCDGPCAGPLSSVAGRRPLSAHGEEGSDTDMDMEVDD